MFLLRSRRWTKFDLPWQDRPMCNLHNVTTTRGAIVSFTKALRDLTDFNKPPRGISSMDEIKVVASMDSLPEPPDVDG
jgi:hypothetical protein